MSRVTEKLKKNKWYENISIIILFLIISLLFIFPFCRTHEIVGCDDPGYHIGRIYDLVNNIKHGTLYPYFYTYSFEKICFPLGIFYPQVTLIPIALLVILFGDYIKGIYAGIFLYTFLTVLFTYIAARKFKFSKIQSVFAAIIYCFCSYRVADIFSRFALGEFIGMVFLPLIVYGLYALMYGNNKDWPYLTLGLGGVIFSHNLSTVMDLLVIIILFVLGFYWMDNKKERLKSCIYAGMFFVGEALIIVIPVIIQEHFQKYGMPTPIELQSHIPSFSDLFNYTINNSIERQGHFSIGIVLLFVIIWGLIKYNKIGHLNRIFITIGTLIFIMCSNLFPWELFNHTPLKIIQFPWRFLGIASMLLSLVGGSLIGTFFNKHTKTLGSRLLMFVGISLLIIIPWFSSTQQYIRNNQEWKVTESSPFGNLKSFYLDQFTPKESLGELNNLQQHIAIVDGVDVTLSSNEIKSVPNGVTYESHKLRNAKKVILPQAIYSGLKITQNGKEISFEKGLGNRIMLKNTGNGPITVVFKPSFILYLSQWISICTTLLVILLFLNRTVKLKNIFKKYQGS